MFPARTPSPSRALARGATGATLLASLLFLAVTLATPLASAEAASAPSIPVEDRDPSEDEVNAIVSVAMRYLYSYQGECFPWVRRVVEQALGRSMGFDYHLGYLEGGAVEITEAEATTGDIIQIADAADTGSGASYPGLHTAIVLENRGAGAFRVIDSNSQFDGIVRTREDYRPAVLAARYPNTIARYYRFPDVPLVPAQTFAPASTTPGVGQAVVRGDGDCLRLRSAPTLAAGALVCAPDGATLTLLGATAEADGHVWQQVSYGGLTGWVAATFLEIGTSASTLAPAPSSTPTTVPSTAAASPTPAATPALTIAQQTPPPAAPPPAREFVAPVEGGLTQGIAGTSDPVLLADSQSFEVESISVLDVESQRFLIHIPGAPALVNSLTSSTLRPDAVVTIRRLGETPPPGPVPSTVSTLPAHGTPHALRTPPADGLTQGMAGTNDPAALASAQPFSVKSVSVLDVVTQRWLVYIVGAPAAVNTLHTGSMTPDSIVTVRRAGGDVQTAGSPASPPPAEPTPSSTPEPQPTATPEVTPTPSPSPTPNPATTSEPQTVDISYYYCEPSSLPQGIGDGGGFCGVMANGQQAYEGAAACSPRSLGQRFRVLGDPTQRVYTCSDIGANASDSHREIWFPNSDAGWTWRETVGATVRIEILAE